MFLCVPGVSCRAIFGVREEILIFGEIFTSVSAYHNDDEDCQDDDD